MTGATGTPPTTPARDTTNATKSVQGSAGSATGATSAPTLTSGSRIETATALPEETVSSRMGMGAVAESGEARSSNTIIIGSDTGRDQQDRGERSDGLTETASRYGRDMGRRTLEAYEQGREGVSNAAGQAWDAAQRTAGQVRRRSGRGLSSAQSVLAENPLVGIMVGTAVGVMVGYLIGQMTASTRTTGTRRYEDRDEFGDRGGYPAGYGGSYSGSSRYPDGSRGTDIHRYADRVRYSDGD
jgi:ElaB/YqjD/DUF883 family membrane-anchored ribosome-binding protein